MLKLRNISLSLLFAINVAHSQSKEHGITFDCDAVQLEIINRNIDDYFKSIGVKPNQYIKKKDGRLLNLSISSSNPGTSTLYIKFNPEYEISNEIIKIPTLHGTKEIEVSSKKEILISLLYPGRNTVFSKDACHLSALDDHINIRQMIVAWSEELDWEFPEGEPSRWNEAYWNDGTPLKEVSLVDAVNDVFLQQNKYSMGCYAATKLVMIQATLDYFHRIKQDKKTLNLIINRLMVDGEPLLGIEPGEMWFFEEDITEQKLRRPGKIIRLIQDIAPENFVPGDWSYFLNPDKDTNKKLGYEGSNAIYLGRALFDDFYNDNNHHYLYNEKLREVYQWRNKVFSRSRDYANITPISPDELHQLSSPPPNGLILKYRAIPYYYGYEKLP